MPTAHALGTTHGVFCSAPILVLKWSISSEISCVDANLVEQYLQLSSFQLGGYRGDCDNDFGEDLAKDTSFNAQ